MIYLIFLPLFLYTLQSLYQRFVSRKEISKESLSFVHVFTVFLLALITFRKLVFDTIGLLYGFFYALLIFLNFKALESVDVSIIYPIKRLGNPILAILIPVIFHETLKLNQIISGFFAIFSVLAFSRIKLPKRGFKLVYLVLILAIICGFLSKIGSSNKETFIIVAYFSASIFLAIFILSRKAKISLTEVKFGFISGVINFFAFFSFLYALDKLPGGIVFPILSTSVVLVPLFAHLIFGEKLTKRWAEAFALALISYLFLFFKF